MVNTNLLKSVIVLAGLNQKKVATEIGISENSFSEKVNNKSSFTIDEVMNICSVCNIVDNQMKCDIFLV